jgi:hypothetical protein
VDFFPKRTTSRSLIEAARDGRRFDLAFSAGF